MIDFDELERRMKEEHVLRMQEIIREHKKRMWTEVYIPFLIAISGILAVMVMTFIFDVTDFVYFILPLCMILWGQFKLIGVK